MKNSNYVDKATRYVVATAQLINPETNFFATVEARFEFGASGRINPELKVFMTRRPK
jgi:hypothetical protein